MTWADPAANKVVTSSHQLAAGFSARNCKVARPRKVPPGPGSGWRGLLQGRIPLSQQPPPFAYSEREGDLVIIEFHLTRLEDMEIGDHLKRCDTAFCDDIAHLCAALVEDYADVAKVFSFVDSSKWRHVRKQLGRPEPDGMAAETDKPGSLAIIRQAWDRLEALDHEERPSQDRA